MQHEEGFNVEHASPFVPIDYKSVLICIPAADGRVEAGFMSGMVTSAANGLFGNMAILAGNSDVGSARNGLTHGFLKSPYEWLVFIDSDIQFTPDDLRKLLEVTPTGAHAELGEPTRNALGQELCVTAEYPKKNETLEPNRFGLGFCRIHREVFERLANLLTEDGQEVLGRYFAHGSLNVDFYPMGCTSDNYRPGEDGGFWRHVRFTGIVPRIEQRTSLIHWAKKAYPYVSPFNGL